MSFYNPFPLSHARSGACRTLILSALYTVFIAVTCTHVAGQTPAVRPVARLVSSSGQVLPLPTRARWAAPAAVVVAPSGAHPAPASMVVSSIERRAFDLINAERARNGEAQLTWDAELCRMAELHSQHMAQENFFSHVGPDGLNMENRAHAIGIKSWRALGENIAYNRGFDDPAVFAVQRWMSSDGHRANILNEKFNRSAIGVVRAADGRVYLTQVFLER